MAKFVYSVASEAGYDPCLVCNSLDRDDQIRLTQPQRLLKFDPSASIGQFEVNGMAVKAIPLLFPEIEFTQYRLNKTAWQEVLKDGDKFFAVGGTNQCCIPLMSTVPRYGSWIATLLWDDRVDRLSSAPLIERVRDHVSRPILERIERRAFNESEPAFVLSEYTARRLSERHCIPRSEVEVVPYPIDSSKFSPEPSGDDPDPEGPVVLFVGRFTDPRKNIGLLIEAFCYVHEAYPSAELWLVGALPDDRIQQMVESREVTGAVSFRDTLPNEDLPKYFRAADVFVIPSNQEGLAIVGLEAMACGTPVIATRCGGPEGYVRHGETGYLVPKGDAEVLAERIKGTLANEELRRDLGVNARELIQREFARSRIRKRFTRVFEEL